MTTLDSRRAGIESDAVSVRVKECDRSDAARWDEFVRSCPEGTFSHLFGWKTVIDRAFGHPTYYLAAERCGSFRGVLPLGHVKSRLFGNALISVPFCVYGGVAARDEATRSALEDAAEGLGRKLGVDYLEVRNREPQQQDWFSKDLYCTFRRGIDADPDVNLKAIPRKHRAVVLKALKSGLRSNLDDDTDRFYTAFSTSYRNLGTPVLKKRYFDILLEVFGKDCEILTVTKDKRTISSVLTYYFRDEALPFYGGGTREARALRANDFMYWEVMQRAAERRCKLFDFGRSKIGTGSYHFKKNWGFTPEPLPYRYRLFHAEGMPDVSPANPKYSFFIGVWKRLPLPIANAVGPLISRNLA